MTHPLEIYQKIESMFLKYGIKSVTMDDIARELGISKKTIYQYVANKNELVHSVLKAYLDRDAQEIQNLRAGASNAIDEWMNIFNYSCNLFIEFNPNVLYDLYKYYPKSWEAFQEYKNKYTYNVIIENLKKGVKEGLYRKNLIPEIIAKMYIFRMEAFLDPANFPSKELTQKEIFSHLLEYHLRGIVSSKGAQLIDGYKLN